MLLNVDKMIYGGDGLARMPANEYGPGKAVFIPFVLAGEQIEADIAEQRAGFARAELKGIVQSSEFRVQPDCPYFGPCGGCQYQHSNYAHQLVIKEGILRETLARNAKITWEQPIGVHAAGPWQYRNRTRLQVEMSPFRLGYFRAGSRQLVAVEQCPISSPLINRGIEAILAIGRSGNVPDALLAVEFFADHADENLLIELHLTSPPRKNDVLLPRLAQRLRALPAIAGIVIMVAKHDGGTQRWTQTVEDPQLFGTDSLTYEVAGQEYRVSAGSFFQVNRHLLPLMVRLVCDGKSGRAAIDLYAGVGLFSLALAKNFERVIAVEGDPTSFVDLDKNRPGNVTAERTSVGEFLGTSRDGKIDLVIVDPPRAGLNREVVQKVLQLRAHRFTYVSCDPVTLARDLRILLDGGYALRSLQMLDLFPQTAHLETIAELDLR